MSHPGESRHDDSSCRVKGDLSGYSIARGEREREREREGERAKEIER